MSLTPEEFARKLEIAVEAEDLEAMVALESEFVEAEIASLPYQSNVGLRGATPEEFEGNVAMSFANGLSRAKRNLEYRLRLAGGYRGPIIVSEGDSWFQYPILLKDVIDQLADTYAIKSLGAAGDTLSNMLSEAEYAKEISSENADFFLFSASGNDVLGGGELTRLLNTFEEGMEISDIVRLDKVDETLTRIESSFDHIIRNALAANSKLNILFHGYDRPLPRENGTWMGRPMSEMGIPRSLQAGVTGFLVNCLNERLSTLEHRFPGKVHHVDCRGRVGNAQQSWYDELHPRNRGFERVASLFAAQMEAIRSMDQSPIATATVSSPSQSEEVWTSVDHALEQQALVEEALIDTSTVHNSFEQPAKSQPKLSSFDQHIVSEFKELERLQTEEDQSKRKRARRQMLPADDENAFERILGESNLFPVNYLSRGAKKARAVAKVRLFFAGEIPAGSGSGFLVAPGLLLTNNHVIESRNTARRAKAVFDFQENDKFENMRAKRFDITDDIFFTSPRHELDFTFVSVEHQNNNGDSLTQFSSFTLIEESGKAVKNESVSIIQHPNGQLKSIALRDSKILGVKGDFIYYSTDTEPGSSGAPVLNDQWLPVALHHRSVPDPDLPGKWIANRGIRISRIIKTLRSAADQNDQNAQKILNLLQLPHPLTSPDATLNAPALRPREHAFISPSISGSSNLPTLEEANFPTNRWDGIEGYDPEFLSEEIALPLPHSNANVREVDGHPDLPYMHFSVVMHDQRKLPMVTACNVDGTRIQRLSRRGAWRFDPRIPQNTQVGNDAYKANDYDRGHLVRRLAPMWGTENEARFAEADTFHYTVSAPQHAQLNRKIWLELEDYLLNWAENKGKRLTIFTGPVFRADDPLYRGIVQVPADYWKVAIAETGSGLRAVGYLHTQKNLIPTVEEAFGNYKTHRLPIHIISELSGLDFTSIQPHDVSGGSFEGTGGIKIIDGPEDIGFV